MLARRGRHPDDPPVPANQSRQEPITRPAGSDEGFIVSKVIRAAAKKWFYQSFDCDLLEQMQKCGLIAQAEGFSVSVMAELELEMESAFQSELSALREELIRSKELTMSMADRANQFEEERDAAQSELAALLSLKESLFTAIAHGDDAHRDWLASAIDAHFSGLEVPEYVASSKDIELAALREELAKIKVAAANVIGEGDALQQRLTAAEPRNSQMILVPRHLLMRASHSICRGNDLKELRTFLAGVPKECNTCDDRKLVCLDFEMGEWLDCPSCSKPTESGASDEPQCLLCLDTKTVPGNVRGGFVKDCPDCCGEEG